MEMMEPTRSVMLQPRSMASQTMKAAESPKTTFNDNDDDNDLNYDKGCKNFQHHQNFDNGDFNASVTLLIQRRRKQV